MCDNQNKMDLKITQKRKGGAEKVREKKRRNLEADAAKCAKLSDLFFQKVADPGPSSMSTHVICTPSPPSALEDYTSCPVADLVASTPSPGAASVVYSSCPLSASEMCTVPPKNAYAVGSSTPIDYYAAENSSAEGAHAAIISLHAASPVASTSSEAVASVASLQDASHVFDEKNSAESEHLTFNYFSRPNKSQLSMFFSYHPKQDTANLTAKKHFYRKDGTNRKWLTFYEERRAFFCSVCLAFSKPTTNNSFIDGTTDWRHVHQRIEEHEKSVSHQNSAEAYFLKATSGDVSSLINHNQMSAHREQVRKRRQILERVVSIVKLIGKCGLSYRGDKFEAAYTLQDPNLDHGNFLELVLLLSKYDICTQEHVNECIEKSKKRHSKGTKGRGSLLTLLSKTTVNAVIEAIRLLIQENIARQVRDAGMFSVQIDTSQDIASRDQLSVIVRYVTTQVHERLLAVVDCKSCTGESLHQMLMKVLDSCKIDVRKCAGNSTDGAANMQGQYNGFSTWLTTVSPGQIHVWCYAHVLNLVLSDTTKATIQSASLFSLLNDIAVFIRDSYLRMNLWENISQDPHRRRLSVIGETRWWSKDAALRKVFGNFSKPDSGLYVCLIAMLSEFQKNHQSSPDARVKAKGFCDSLLRYETILTAQVFLRIFELTTPLSKYLQTSGMEILTAYRMVNGVEENLKCFARSFDTVTEAADKFVKWADEQLQHKYEDLDLEIEKSLPIKRIRKRKKMPDELSDDTVIPNALTAFSIQVHNVILDTVLKSMHQRFSAHGSIYADFACLDPRNFSVIREKGLTTLALQELSKLLLKYDERATAENLQFELTSLAAHWDKLKASALDEYTVRIATTIKAKDQDTESEMELVNKSCSTCKNCPVCCYQLLQRYNLLTDAYNVIGLAYKFLLTLSVSQVACERSFSTLKFIKSRLRSTISQQHLESFMLMATEKEVLMSLDVEEVIDRVAERSDLLMRLLIP